MPHLSSVSFWKCEVPLRASFILIRVTRDTIASHVLLGYVTASKLVRSNYDDVHRLALLGEDDDLSS